MEFVSHGLVLVGLLLQALLLFYLAKGPLARYFPLLLYVVSSAVYTTGGEVAWRAFGLRSHEYFSFYWAGELLLDLLQFFLVISFTVRAMEGTPIRPKVVKFMAFILVAVVATPFLLFERAMFGSQWNRSVSQLLNFGAAVMNLALWSAFIVSRRQDRQFLTVSAGLGVSVAGAALTLGVKRLTNGQGTVFEVTDWIHRITQVASPLIWCYAFRPPKAKHTSQEMPPAVPTPSAS